MLDSTLDSPRPLVHWPESVHSIICAVTAILLGLLARLLAYKQHLEIRLHETCSTLLRLPACGVHAPRESAVVVLGAEGDLGRQTALAFSELGYTVFALCRSNGLEELEQSTSTTAKTSSVSCLLYEWQHRRKLSSSAAWGLIAPIALDAESAPQRAHASATIHAYCAANFLHLVGMILAPPSVLSEWHDLSDDGSRAGATDWFAHTLGSGLAAVGPLARSLCWAARVRRFVAEPAFVVQDYVDLLTASSGRVILLTRCPQKVFSTTPPPPIDLAYTLISECLSDELCGSSVRLSSIRIAASNNFLKTLRPPYSVEQQVLATGLKLRSNSPSVRGRDFPILSELQNILHLISASTDDLDRLLVQLVNSRYPKRELSLGPQPFLHTRIQIIPGPVQRLLGLFIAYFL